MTLRKTYAASGMLLLFTTRPAGIFFFNHTFARHRPKNGATATIPKATAKAMRINISFVDPAWKLPTRGEPAEQPMQLSVQLPQYAKSCNFGIDVSNIPPSNQSRYPTFVLVQEPSGHPCLK
jgi:hypothetical protein